MSVSSDPFRDEALNLSLFLDAACYVMPPSNVKKVEHAYTPINITLHKKFLIVTILVQYCHHSLSHSNVQQINKKIKILNNIYLLPQYS